MKHSELRQAVRDLQNRGLLHSARWAAEQLYGLEDEVPGAREDEDDATPAAAPSVTTARASATKRVRRRAVAARIVAWCARSSAEER